MIEFQFTVGTKSITTEIGEGIIRMSHMTNEELAEYLLVELFTRTWRAKARELTAEEIQRIRLRKVEP